MKARGWIVFPVVAFLASCGEAQSTTGGQESGPPFEIARLVVEPDRIVSSPAFPGRDLRVSGIDVVGGVLPLEPGRVTFRSSDPAVATVSSDGYVTFLQPGIATITVAAGSKKTSVPVDVASAPVSLVLVQVGQDKATLGLAKLTPGRQVRLFASEHPGRGVTRVPECVRLDVELLQASVIFETTVPESRKDYFEITIPLPAGASVLGVQAVADYCAVSRPLVIEQR